jgi:uncharacterized membrane protein
MPERLAGTPTAPAINTLDFGDLSAALRLGWSDFRRAPQFGLFFAAVFVAGGWIMFYALTRAGMLWLSLPAAAGFPIIGPFVACGLYEVSRRLERGLPLSWGEVLGVIWAEKNRQIPSMAVVIVVFFLIWTFLGHMIFALFMGLSVMTNVSSSLAIYLTPNGLGMLAMGTLVGAVLATLLFSITVVSLPLLLDRDVDFVTAMITSFATVRDNPVVMLAWGVIIAGLTFLAMLPGFLGLFVVFPLLGHATWHLYRRALA